MGVKQRVQMTPEQMRTVNAFMIEQDEKARAAIPSQGERLVGVGRGIAEDQAKKYLANKIMGEKVAQEGTKAVAGTAAESGTLSSLAPYLQKGAGALGAAAGAYGAFQGIKNKDPITAGLGGLGTSIGLNTMGLAALGPMGILAGALAPAVIAQISKMGDKDRWKTERGRLIRLQEQGMPVDSSLLASLMAMKKGRSKDELIKIEEAKGDKGNVKFAQSRDEADLRPEDIWGYATFGEKLGKDWFGTSEANRRAIAQAALDQGKVREQRGTLDVDWTPELTELANKYLQGQATAGKDSKPQPVARPIAGQIQSGVLRRDPSLPVVNIEDMVRQVPEETKNRLRRAKYLRK